MSDVRFVWPVRAWPIGGRAACYLPEACSRGNGPSAVADVLYYLQGAPEATATFPVVAPPATLRPGEPAFALPSKVDEENPVTLRPRPPCLSIRAPGPRPARMRVSTSASAAAASPPLSRSPGRASSELPPALTCITKRPPPAVKDPSRWIPGPMLNRLGQIRVPVRSPPLSWAPARSGRYSPAMLAHGPDHPTEVMA